MRKRSIKYIIIVIIGFGLTACFYDNKDDLYDVIIIPGDGSCEFGEISYQNDLVTIIDLYCNDGCHNAVDRQGNVVLETYNNVQPYLDDGSFIGSIKYESPFAPMPPGSKLSQCDIDKIDSWIANGAPNN